MSDKKDYSKRSASTTLGWILWRGGLYFSSAYIGWEGTVRIWRFLIRMHVPTQLMVAIMLVIAGFVIIMGALIAERIQDSKTEVGLRDD